MPRCNYCGNVKEFIVFATFNLHGNAVFEDGEIVEFQHLEKLDLRDFVSCEIEFCAVCESSDVAGG